MDYREKIIKGISDEVVNRISEDVIRELKKTTEGIPSGNGKIFIDDIVQNINNLISPYQGEFIIRKSMDQSVTLSDIYPNSVNTIRPISLRHKGKKVALSYQLLFGNSSVRLKF